MKRRGFTLIEAIIALTIAAVGFAGIYELYAGAARGERLSAEISHASALADAFIVSGAAAETGEENGYAWTITRAASVFPGTETIDVEITTPSGRTVRVISETPAEGRETR
ncbi:type IV pilus modification PilV family protein [Hyphobacterium marinum]|uniref:Prepilin-type N-terminal cleavage/methylation domain-containing protein n=1 Tax=Hyphobacterium marinum TaxID=3116574 RepID=A0ABU7LVY6_9PROT|nr:prepilin-type N-terminal cleavage/methylation domain-containing protein [Hyphobacterium sp. Y6023]MEE2565724.1 prepilin-type N-terminal cleavage/methylation domain-containing protein [Hyphobacterium sp. Y6023]